MEQHLKQSDPMRLALAESKSKETVHDEEPKKKSREKWRKAKELQKARKAGTAPIAVDVEGRDVNPYVLQYIANAPLYYGAQGLTLITSAQREEDKGELSKKFPKGLDTSRLVTKFRKGPCESCGAMTHKRKDCLERPRKVLAIYANSLIVHDEHIVQNEAVNFDGKRVRWSSCDPANHREIVEEYVKVKEAKRQLKAEKLNDPAAEISEISGNEDKYVDEVDMPRTKMDSKERIRVRNLRIREDTAKYLRNTDPKSTFYDPKTRSMRDNPNPQVPAEELDVDVHLLAEATKLQLLQKQ
uniref:Pre-mRNA-splicing factor SLU7 n=1 Tax=Glossina austeni TaxID=7395 RepID=A0A1A9VKS2_GLOAU